MGNRVFMITVNFFSFLLSFFGLVSEKNIHVINFELGSLRYVVLYIGALPGMGPLESLDHT